MGSVVEELNKRPDLLSGFDETFATAKPYLVPDNSRFWYTDIFNFLNVLDIKMNSLRAYLIPKGFLSTLSSEIIYKNACESVKSERELYFIKKVIPDIGTNLDERKLITIIFSRLNEYSKNNFGLEIPHADCTSKNFPSFYVFFYTYYFRYIKQKSTIPEINDCLDLSNVMAAPYCERYYCEKKFANILKLQVKNHIPPSSYELANKMYKDGLIEEERYRKNP